MRRTDCCARRLTLTPLRLWTSIRVQDSLARSVSYFMAELERTGQTVQRIEDDTRRNFWLSADQAKEYGLVGNIVAHVTELDGA